MHIDLASLAAPPCDGVVAVSQAHLDLDRAPYGEVKYLDLVSLEASPVR